MGRRMNSSKQIKKLLGIIIVVICISIGIFNGDNLLDSQRQVNTNDTLTYFNIEDIPEYTDQIYITLNNNKPYFEENEYKTEGFEVYSKLDSLGRCGVAYANICKEIMPTEERGDISRITPTGWKQAKYDGKYLYNRCHLIGHQLAGEDANELNLITGTAYFNVNRNAYI